MNLRVKGYNNPISCDPFKVFYMSILVTFMFVKFFGIAQEKTLYDDGTFNYESIAICNEAQIRKGAKGWLFKDDELVTEWGINEFWLSELGKAYAIKGIKVYVVVVPSRSTVYFDEVKNLFPDIDIRQESHQGYLDFLNRFQNNGFIVVNIADPLISEKSNESVFFKRDNHWTSAGSRIAAREVANTIMDEEGSREFNEIIFRTTLLKESVIKGSYVNLINSVCEEKFPVLLEKANYFYTETTSENGLLTSTVLPETVLLGTSNSKRDEDFNFSGFLSEALGVEVLNYAMGGLGAFGSMEAFLLGVDYKQNPPARIIWEFPVRYVDDEVGFRRLVPAIYGQCSLSANGLEVDLNEAIARVTTRAGDEFLVIDYEDPTVNEFSILIEYSNGEIKNFEIKRSSRINSEGEFYFDIRNELEKISPVSVQITNMQPLSFSLKSCSYTK